MTRQRRPFKHKPGLPLTPAHKAVRDWLSVNRGFYANFRDWLYHGGYGPSAMNIYGVAVRLALSLLNKPYWHIDPEADLNRVRDYIREQYPSEGTRSSYFKGIAKLEAYLREQYHQPAPEKKLNWDYHTGSLPTWMAEAVRAYVQHCRLRWRPERQHEASYELLSSLTHPLRWMVAQATLTDLTEVTPQLWYAYADARLAEGVKPVTLNGALSRLHGWLYYLAEQGQSICQRLLQVEPLDAHKSLPRDVPPEQLRCVLHAIQTAACSLHAGVRRMGLMDQAWFLLMLHSGLRLGEVRYLRLNDIDWERRLIRIEQSKGLKDRLVPVSDATIEALRAYLPVRGPAESLPEQVFLYRHKPLTKCYAEGRLRKYYAPRCGVRVTPHQLRHSCATLLLNAGAPVLTVQTILGHRHIDTTLGYARLYDGTVAADYYRAMAQVENRLNLAENAAISPPSPGELVALVDSLRNGTLNEQQAEVVRALRAGILALAEQTTSAANPSTPSG